MRVEVWSDVVCPWCYIGKRRLEKALTQFGHADEVQVVWRSYQLDPSFPKGVRQPVHEYLATKVGATLARARGMTDQVRVLAAQEGLAFDTEQARMVNTVDAHRVAHLAKAHGLLGQMQERLMRAHHVEGQIVNEPSTLVRLAGEVGVPAEEVHRVLQGDDYAADVRADAARAAELGATGVPFFVLDGGYSISGAQPVETFLSALHAAHDQAAKTTR